MSSDTWPVHDLFMNRDLAPPAPGPLFPPIVRWALQTTNNTGITSEFSLWVRSGIRYAILCVMTHMSPMLLNLLCILHHLYAPHFQYFTSTPFPCSLFSFVLLCKTFFHSITCPKVPQATYSHCLCMWVRSKGLRDCLITWSFCCHNWFPHSLFLLIHTSFLLELSSHAY